MHGLTFGYMMLMQESPAGGRASVVADVKAWKTATAKLGPRFTTTEKLDKAPHLPGER